MLNRMMYPAGVGDAILRCHGREKNVEKSDASRLFQQFLILLELRFLSRPLVRPSSFLADPLGFVLSALLCRSRPPDP